MFLFEFGVYIRLTSQIISVSLIFGKLYLRYLKFDINSFVETSRSIKWCPGPGCQRAVRLPDVEVGRMSYSIGTIVEKKEPWEGKSKGLENISLSIYRYL